MDKLEAHRQVSFLKEVLIRTETEIKNQVYRIGQNRIRLEDTDDCDLATLLYLIGLVRGDLIAMEIIPDEDMIVPPDSHERISVVPDTERSPISEMAMYDSTEEDN